MKSPKYLLVTAIKNEGPYLLEWVAHHLSVGVDHFLFVTNDCVDGSNEIVERLQEMGIATLAINPNVLVRDPVKWQRTAQGIAQYYPVYQRAEWIIHCDVDEFIQIKCGDTLDDLVAKLDPVDVISLTSVAFNSNGINELHDHPVVEQFIQAERYITGDRNATNYLGADKVDQSAVKPVFRNRIKVGIRGNHRPYRHAFSQSGYIWKDGSGRVKPIEFTDTRIKALLTRDTIQHVQLNHYAIRSVEASMIKFDRGDVTGNPRLDRSLHYFRNYDNPGQDLPEYSEISFDARSHLNGFHADPVLGDLHKRAFAWHKAKFQEIIRQTNGYVLARQLGYFDTERANPFLEESRLQTEKQKAPLPAQVALNTLREQSFELPTIASMWVGPPMTFVEHLVVRSFLDAGHKFVLYSTDKLKDIPEGVTLADPRDIYEAEFETGPDLRHNNAVYCDIFRLHMIKETGAIWADMDAYCLRPFIFPNEYAVGYEFNTTQEKEGSVANGILGFPKNSETLRQCIELVSEPCPVPPFFNYGRRKRLRERKANGESFGFQDFSWGTSGPRLIDFYMKLSDEIQYAMPKDVFYPGPRAFRRPLLNPDYPIETFEKPETVSVHIFGKTKTFMREEFDGLPPEGSYLDTVCKRHGIDPKKYPL